MPAVGRLWPSGDHDDGVVGDCHGDGSHDDGGVGDGDDSDDSFEARTMSCISL